MEAENALPSATNVARQSVPATTTVAVPASSVPHREPERLGAHPGEERPGQSEYHQRRNGQPRPVGRDRAASARGPVRAGPGRRRAGRRPALDRRSGVDGRTGGSVVSGARGSRRSDRSRVDGPGAFGARRPGAAWTRRRRRAERGRVNGDSGGTGTGRGGTGGAIGPDRRTAGGGSAGGADPGASANGRGGIFGISSVSPAVRSRIWVASSAGTPVPGPSVPGPGVAAGSAAGAASVLAADCRGPLRPAVSTAPSDSLRTSG